MRPVCIPNKNNNGKAQRTFCPLPPCRLRSVSISVVAQAILPVELIDTSLGSRCLLRAGVELMALGAYFDVDLRRSGAGHEGVAAVAGDSCLVILGMDSLSHDFLLTWTPDAASHSAFVSMSGLNPDTGHI